MAKLIREFKGDFNEVVQYSKDIILENSRTATLEDEVYHNINGIKIAFLVFERYSLVGGNRLSLSLSIIGEGDEIKLTAITTGGSQAILYKINTVGEEEFLLQYRRDIDELIKRDNETFVRKLYVDSELT